MRPEKATATGESISADSATASNNVFFKTDSNNCRVLCVYKNVIMVSFAFVYQMLWSLKKDLSLSAQSLYRVKPLSAMRALFSGL
jgi:hypothetical protein